MKFRTNSWLNRLKESLKNENLQAGKPLVELWGKERILIEHHDRVLDYSPEQIRIKVSYGEICISGKRLQFAKLSSQQLVITGCAETILLAGRCKD